MGRASMTTFQRLCCSLIAALLLGGCGSSQEPDPSVSSPTAEKPLDDMVGAMDKARAVEDTTMQHKEDLDRALLESEGAN